MPYLSVGEIAKRLGVDTEFVQAVVDLAKTRAPSSLKYSVYLTASQKRLLEDEFDWVFFIRPKVYKRDDSP